MRVPKAYESPLAPQLAEEILNIPIEHEGDFTQPRTIGEMVRGWAVLIERANDQLRQSHLAGIVAKSIAQDLKKRGDATIVVRHDGTVVLRVSYAGADEPPVVELRQDSPSVVKVNRSSLPLLDTLREEAAGMGVDITHLGRQRKAIYEYLQTYRKNVGAVAGL